MKRLLLLLLALLLLLLPALASAQTVQILTPTNVFGFPASTDQNTTFNGAPVLTSYQVEFFLQINVTNGVPAGPPQLVTNLGKPTPDATNNITSPPIIPMITAGNVYYAYVSAIGPGGTSARTVGVGPFGVPAVPKAPGAPVIK